MTPRLVGPNNAGPKDFSVKFGFQLDFSSFTSLPTEHPPSATFPTATMPQSALLLGSGFVATPTVELLANAGVHVTVASRTLASAQKLAGNFPNAKGISLDVNDTSALENAVAQHDVTISLIPYTYHAAVIKAAIKAKKNVVTTSYVSPAMEELDAECKAAGITVMNEIGVSRNDSRLHASFVDHFSLTLGMPSDRPPYPPIDLPLPSIDHLYAVDVIDRVHREGGSVKSFRSFCGGLPAPESMSTMIMIKSIETNFHVRLGQPSR